VAAAGWRGDNRRPRRAAWEAGAIPDVCLDKGPESEARSQVGTS